MGLRREGALTCTKGKCRVKLLPRPGSLTNRMVPFIKCMRRLQMDKPRPVPATTFLAESA